MAYLRLIGNPHDDTAFERVVNLPPNFYGKNSTVNALSLVGGAVLLWMAWGLGKGAWTGSIVSDLEHSEETAVKESAVGPVADILAIAEDRG